MVKTTIKESLQIAEYNLFTSSWLLSQMVHSRDAIDVQPHTEHGQMEYQRQLNHGYNSI